MIVVQILDVLLGLVISVTVAASFAYLWHMGRLLRLLRETDDPEFQRLGQPSLLKPTGESRRRVMEYVTEGAFLESSSGAIRVTGRNVQQLLFICKGGLLSTVLLAILESVLR